MNTTGPKLDEHEQRLSDTADLASELHASLLGFDAALTILADDRVLALIPPVKPGQRIPGGFLPHLGIEGGHRYDFVRYLQRLRQEPQRSLTARLWASNALIRFGEELSRHNYFDHNPCLELVYHLRNAAAHSERFRIDKPEKLDKFPAQLTAGRCHWEITAELDGTPLYEFVSVGDVASIINHAGIHLRNQALARHVT
jgi:hypothetical protein